MKIDIRPKSLVIGLLVVLVASYSLYQARFLILGPQIVVTSHEDGRSVDGHLITVTGLARNISKISLNDRQIFTDKDGAWSEELLVSEGMNTITVRASDRFGRETTKNIQIIY